MRRILVIGMTEELQVYKCNICGNVVEVLHSGAGRLVCCGQPMELLQEKTEDVGKEKHMPVVEKGDEITVKVGLIPHPMESDHYIEWIELITNDKVYRKFLKPGDEPEAKFKVKAEEIEVRVYCNLHGVWKSKA